MPSSGAERPSDRTAVVLADGDVLLANVAPEAAIVDRIERARRGERHWPIASRLVPLADVQRVAPAGWLEAADPPAASARMAELRADALHRLLASARAAHVERVGDVAALADLAGWQSEHVEQALDTLIADGRLGEDARGRLVVAEPGAEAAA